MNTDILTYGAKTLGIDLTAEQVQQFVEYKTLLQKWNEKINLTAIIKDEEIMLNQFVDSLTISRFIPQESSLIDVGTGAGFPGLPLAITRKDLKITLNDSLAKRINFLEDIISQLGITNASAVHARAEDLSRDKRFREKFTVSTARAVASLPVLLEYCLPFVENNGIFIAMKGSDTNEISQSKKALEILGGEIEDVVEMDLPSTEIKRTIILVRKYRHTPTTYPIKAGKPTKMPLL
jgi:16S rRNA (guanine527-N7)-methyltransferase